MGSSSGRAGLFNGSHWIQQIIAGWFLGFLVALIITRLDAVETLARVSIPWAIFLSLFSTTYILGCLLLAAHIGKMETDQKTLDKWLQTALRNTKSSLTQGGELLEKKTAERITPHEVVSYMIPAGAFLSSTLFPALLSLSHPHHPRSPRHTPLAFYRPYTTTSTGPSLSFWVIGVLGLVLLDILKSAVASRKKRELWPVWKQAVFYSGFYAISTAWVLAGSGIVHDVDIIGSCRGYGGAERLGNVNEMM